MSWWTLFGMFLAAGAILIMQPTVSEPGASVAPPHHSGARPHCRPFTVSCLVPSAGAER